VLVRGHADRAMDVVNIKSQRRIDEGEAAHRSMRFVGG
jgi:hypothetical protein